jgi:nucleotide sugar dehydrogenase
MTKFKVGIIGYGFVGESQAFAFSPVADIKIFDIEVAKRTHELDEVLNQDLVFVCIPTPMKEDGTQDLSLVEGFFHQVEKFKAKPIYILKSTVLPGTTQMLEDKFNLDIVFCPEFLTEKTAKLDMLTQSRIVIGGSQPLKRLKVLELFKARFGNKHYIMTDSKSAEFIKYMSNNFLTVKTSFMNEYYDLVQEVGGDWDQIVEGMIADPRIGNSHTQVPGHDGKRGFGGSCFPKDINAIVEFSKMFGVDMNVLEAAWKTNLRVRPEQDWKLLIGRAVSK